ncbi:flagellar export chaperone FliS [Bordetella genomosp. 9]|uniref:Flagellar secretion chaperone FliS n=1 Tax=Bordetella genomosp. 9 TaxID=1416803 RepID=A0A1W6Z1D2_9BORD|nr:flagellar export chaperone FliS [Bordetella genomosp. 9]ARP86919.1 flagellar export chaperone FliS [Bordetella genomosp. 9]ARP90904.1 flagellar export chaperone FliS [Bordetella genomosp. 9]
MAAYASRRPDNAYSVRSYADVGVETQVMSASAERLITLLYTAARAAIGQARIHIEQGNVAKRGAAIAKAARLIDEGLKSALDLEAGGEVAANLNNLYDYILRTLVNANLKSDAALLETADALLAQLQEAWQTSVDRPGEAARN